MTIPRRNFLKITGISSIAIASGLPHFSFAKSNALTLVSNRPAIANRKFVSKAVEAKLLEVKAAIKDPELAWMFENCFPNTLDTTITHGVVDGKLDTFVITGDIHAMWLRDSTAQIWPYLPFVNKDVELKKLIQGLVNRQTKCVLIDTYANAFNISANVEDKGWQQDDTAMKPELHERKWEIDSLCYVIRLAHGYWKTTQDASLFDADWHKAMRAIVNTFKEQQRKTGNGSYRFRRNGSNPTDTAGFDGYGNKVNPVGLIASLFRPSDDGTIFPFLIPSNLFAVQALKQLEEIYTSATLDLVFAKECRTLADEVDAAVAKYGIINHSEFGKMYAYEVDGYGSMLVMDDANVPSLLSLPYLNSIDYKDPLYINTRKYALSERNPWFFNGKAAQGIGGPHTGRDTIWPMGIIIRAMTSTDEEEIRSCITMLKATHAGTGFIHESFYKDDAKYFSRKWFAWANTLFGELMVKLYQEKPHILKKLY